MGETKYLYKDLLEQTRLIVNIIWLVCPMHVTDAHEALQVTMLLHHHTERTLVSGNSGARQSSLSQTLPSHCIPPFAFVNLQCSTMHSKFRESPSPMQFSKQTSANAKAFIIQDTHCEGLCC